MYLELERLFYFNKLFIFLFFIFVKAKSLFKILIETFEKEKVNRKLIDIQKSVRICETHRAPCTLNTC